MISNEALSLLKEIVDTYNSSGKSEFFSDEFAKFKNLFSLLEELDNHCLINYNESTIADTFELTDNGINYKF